MKIVVYCRLLGQSQNGFPNICPGRNGLSSTCRQVDRCCTVELEDDTSGMASSRTGTSQSLTGDPSAAVTAERKRGGERRPE